MTPKPKAHGKEWNRNKQTKQDITIYLNKSFTIKGGGVGTGKKKHLRSIALQHEYENMQETEVKEYTLSAEDSQGLSFIFCSHYIISTITYKCHLSVFPACRIVSLCTFIESYFGTCEYPFCDQYPCHCWVYWAWLCLCSISSGSRQQLPQRSHKSMFTPRQLHFISWAGRAWSTPWLHSVVKEATAASRSHGNVNTCLLFHAR